MSLPPQRKLYNNKAMDRSIHVWSWYRFHLRKSRYKTYAAHVLGQNVLFVVLFFTGMLGFAEEYSTIQSTVRPLGLEIVDRVKLAESDAASSVFQKSLLPFFQKFIELNLGERTSLTVAEVANRALDPEKLSLAVEASVRVYFVHEGADYRNTLGFNTESGGANAGKPKLIFPDVSHSLDTIRSVTAPLCPGDYVDVGTYAAGTQLRFFLIADGADGGRNVFSTAKSLNQDGFQHVVAFVGDEIPYLLLGFEDLWGGGDRDYNDCMFAVDIGEQNVKALREMASPPVEELLAQLVDRLTRELTLLEPGTVAYSGFTNRIGQRPEFSVTIDRMVRSRFSEMVDFDLISMDNLRRTLKKAHATAGDLIDTSMVLKIGKALSADYFLTGLIIPTGKSVIVFGRIINMDTEAIEASAQIVLNSLP